MERSEMVLAQRLASGEPKLRKRALRILHSYLKEHSAEGDGLDEASLQRLCKGIHYAVWMQDKPLLQEELANEIVNLINIFPTDEQSIRFVRSLFSTISQEWPNIDRWRMDKFLMLVRRLFRAIFTRLSAHKWECAMAESYLALFRETIASTTSDLCESLKYHCAAVYLDELDNSGAGELTPEKLLNFLRPYVELLKCEKLSIKFFEAVCTEVFRSILQEHYEHLAAQSEAMSNEISDSDDHMEAPEQETRMKFDLGQIATLLFEAGSQPTVNAKRRKCMYALSKRFEAASHHQDPFTQPKAPTKPVKRFGKKKRLQKQNKRTING